MRDEAFRAFLTPRLAPRSVGSYLSNARFIERALAIDLDRASLNAAGIAALIERLSRLGTPAARVSDCGSALRQYGQFASGTVALAELPPLASLAALTIGGLLRLHVGIGDELRHRGVVRTGNGPVGDYAEHLFAAAFGWTLAPNSSAGFDAVDLAGARYQIKGRRLSRPDASRQLGAIRNLSDHGFDHLAAILFDARMTVRRAVILPHALVCAVARPSAHTKSDRVTLSERLCARADVQDVTDQVQAVASSLD